MNGRHQRRGFPPLSAGRGVCGQDGFLDQDEDRSARTTRHQPANTSRSLQLAVKRLVSAATCALIMSKRRAAARIVTGLARAGQQARAYEW